MDSKEVSLIIKWSGKEFPIEDLTEHDTVAVLRHEICKKTQVRPERQKLLNLKYKGKPVTDDVRLGAMDLKPNFKVMMVGSLESDIKEASSRPEDVGSVVNDFDNEEEDNVAFENKEVYLAKINKRIKDYTIKELNPPREGKRLLVLDIDYTIFDHRSAAENGTELMRPYLHEFLTSAYQDYDIAIWSATSMRWIVEKMKLLGVTDEAREYKLVFMLDDAAMITVLCPLRGVIEVKPLGVIWGKYSQYSSKNTIMFDDLRRNFLMNPKSGLRIKPFSEAHLNRHKDKELVKLAKYLKAIAEHCDDFDTLNHRRWEDYLAKKRSSH
ncbi:ubiquitin-like domain-containing CTD phosphatase 1 [Anopheles merus]|uniref:Ubiquitin-like domain-containing CTD phosphatase 1 n=1 Tax=Anopheles merus TaxID=30066 RepID=A0A182V7U4_ANOME|nr:ubiquitin-like domain-containing CTD phosphatase 1 [Anopheles merus]